MKVAIWGSYNYGNYGDDVMAIMMCQHLKKMGVVPSVYRLNQKLAKKYEVDTTDSLEELLDKAKFCIIGGGTILLEPLYGAIGSAMNEDIQQLWEIVNHKKCPLFCISIGGDGTSVRDRKLTIYQWRLLESEMFQGGTVRLEQDIKFFEKMNKSVDLYSDIVLSLNNFWTHKKKERIRQDPLKIGLCLSNTSNTRQFATLLTYLASLRRNLIFYFIHPHLPNNDLPVGSLLPPISPWIKHYFYQNPAEMIDFISSLDLLVSTYMHPNITALALGIPIISLDSRVKTISVMNSLSLETINRPLSKKSLFELLALLSSKKKILRFREKFEFKKIEQAKILSNGHFDYLTKLVEEFR
jgi:polysaccharide pyruvyl transferase WcaK-like protein